MYLLVSALFPPEPVVSANLSRDIANSLSSDFDLCIVSPPPSRPLGFISSYKSICHSTNSLYKHIQLNSYICPQSNLIGRLLESISFGIRCSTYIQNNAQNIKVIYANTWPLFAQFLTVKASIYHKIPIIIHVQDIYPESLSNKLPIFGKFITWLFLPIDKFTLQNATAVVTISDKMKKYLVKTRNLRSKKVHVIPNWQDEEEFIRLKQLNQKNEFRGLFTFMFLGNIGPVAGVDLLIDAFVKTNLQDCRLVIAGSGSQKENLKRRCYAQHFTNIEFWNVPDGKVPEIQDYADVMLLPIKKGAAGSSIPSKLPAYMFSQKPIIACVDEGSDTAKAIISSGCGWALPPENMGQLVEKMKQVLTLSEEELQEKGKNGFEYAMENFSKKKNLDLLTRLIIQTLPK